MWVWTNAEKARVSEAAYPTLGTFLANNPNVNEDCHGETFPNTCGSKVAWDDLHVQLIAVLSDLW